MITVLSKKDLSAASKQEFLQKILLSIVFQEKFSFFSNRNWSSPTVYCYTQAFATEAVHQGCTLLHQQPCAATPSKAVPLP
jgi:hypothetical protein